MDSTFINTRADLDAAPAETKAAFMAALAGSVWRLEKDDEAKLWRAVQDANTIERFDFALADFADVPAPQLPVYTPPPSTVPQQVTRAQGKMILIQMGLWPAVLGFVAGIADPVQKAVAEVALHDTTHWQRSSPFLSQAATALGLTEAQMDDLFIQASQVAL